MRFEAVKGLMTLGCLGALLFQSNVAAWSELAPSLTFRAAIQKSAEQDPGIVGLDMLIFKTHYPVVKHVFPGSPAYNQGILPGDEILAINGFSTIGRSSLEVDRMISDVPGTPVALKVQRGSLTAEVILMVESLSYVSNNLRSKYRNVSFNSYDSLGILEPMSHE